MTDTIATDTIKFDEGNQAHVVRVKPGVSGATLMQGLNLDQPPALLLLFTGVDPKDDLSDFQRARLTELFSRGTTLAAGECRATILTHGTQTSVIGLLGQGIGDRDLALNLIGVAPADKVTPDPKAVSPDKVRLEPHHTHFALVEGNDWDQAREALFNLAETLSRATAGTPDSKEIPVVAIVAGAANTHDILHCVRHKWPVIIVEASGGTADQLVDLINEKQAIDRRRQKRNDNFLRKASWLMQPQVLRTGDPALLEVLSDGKLRVLDRDSNGERLQKMITRRLKPTVANKVLTMAWKRFADYDKNAGRQQRSFDRLLKWILGLGVVITILAVLSSTLPPTIPTIPVGSLSPINTELALRALTVIVSVILTGLVAYRNRFDAGARWILLRANAESIKREIYPFRAKAEVYGQAALTQKKDATRESELADRVGTVGRSTMRTEVSASALEPHEDDLPPEIYAAGEDDGFSDLDAEQYIKIRIGDQLNYYRKRTLRLERQFRQLQIVIFVATGTGTLLAAFGAEAWVPIAVAFSAAIAALLEAKQTESTLIKYNQAETDLANLKAWWDGLPDAKKNAESFDTLVKLTEQIIETEISGWSRRMQNALEELRKGTEGENPPGNGGAGGPASSSADTPGQPPQATPPVAAPGQPASPATP